METDNMTNVVELKTRPTEVVESVVERLEEALEAAKKGTLVAIAIATVEVDGSVGLAWSETDDFGKLLGAVARMQHRLNVIQDTAVK